MYRYESVDKSSSLKHWKYIDKWKVNDKWRYLYPSKKNNKNNADATKQETKKSNSSLFDRIANKISDSVNKIKTSFSENSVLLGKNFVNNSINKNKEVNIITNPDKEYKYIAKVPLDNGKYRYFYDQKEYDNYLRGRSFTEKLSDLRDVVVNKIKEVKDKTLDNVNKFLDKFTTTRVDNRHTIPGKKPEASLKTIDGKRIRFFDDYETYARYANARNFVRNIGRKLNFKDDIAELPRKTKEWSRDEDVSIINRNFSYKNNDTSMNCAYCSIAYDLRRKGYDVIAVEEQSILDAYEILELYGVNSRKQQNIDNVLVDFDEIGGTKASRRNAHMVMKEKLLSEGDGSRGIFCISWRSGSGHAVNWEVKDGEVYIIDTQINTIYKYDDYESLNLAGAAMYVRTDNAEPGEEALDFVRPRVKKRGK